MGWLNNLQGAYHQLKPFDKSTYATNSAAESRKSGGGGGGGGWGSAPTPTPQKSAVTEDAAKYARDFASQSAQIAALQAQIAARPKLANFDVMSNWRSARATAEKMQNPEYERKLNAFLKDNATLKARGAKKFSLEKDNINFEKTTTLGENQVQRVRTGEDVANAIQGVNIKEGEFQADEGQIFDQNYRKAAEELAASGAATTGMGKQQSSDMLRLRNVQSQRQLDEFQGQRQAKELFKTRTFDDLLRGDTQATQMATSKTRAAKFDLDSYLEDLSIDERKFRESNETERLNAIFNDSQNYEKTGVEQFLAGLAGSGYNNEDIAYNRSVYA